MARGTDDSGQMKDVCDHSPPCSVSATALLVSKWYHYEMALTVRTDPALEEALTALATSEGASRQEIIRRAVLERFQRNGHTSRVSDSAGRMIDRWGDVIERLGSE